MEPPDRPQPDKAPEEHARQQTGQQQVRLRIDERNMTTSYANAFRTNGSAEEVILDFGVNLFSPTPPQQGQQSVQGEVTQQINTRVVLTYYTAKRLALALGQMIRQYEEQFGSLELDVARRRKNA